MSTVQEALNREEVVSRDALVPSDCCIHAKALVEVEIRDICRGEAVAAPTDSLISDGRAIDGVVNVQIWDSSKC